MISFLDLDIMTRAILIACLFFTFVLLLLWGFIELSQRKKIRVMMIPIFLLLFLDLVYLISLQEGVNLKAHPLIVPVIMIPFGVIYSIRGIYQYLKYYETHLGRRSIREAFDHLPMGLCFSKENGILLLTNHKMNELAEAITGGNLQNVNEVFPNNVHSEVKLKNGEVWSFQKNRFKMEGEYFAQMTATNITELSIMKEELDLRNQRLNEQKVRLRTLMEEISQIAQEKEVLESKIKLHSDFGYLLLASRRFLLSTDQEQELGEIVAMWANMISRLQYSMESKLNLAEDLFLELKEASQAIGCQIILEGELPSKKELQYTIYTAIKEAVINAVRHGGANQVFVDVKKEKNQCEVVISDNATVSVKEVREGGGLSSLREKIESLGGTLFVVVKDGVVILVSLPIEEKREEELDD